jgi:hypothetical protein
MDIRGDMEIFNIIASLSTAVGSILIFFTLIEMIRQRRALYRPEIIIESCTEKEESENAELIKKINKIEQIEISGINFIKLFNIGLGAGKNINLHWDFNINDLISYISSNDYMKEYDIEYDKQKNTIFVKSKVIIGVYININLDWLNSVDHLLPISSNYSPEYINIPSSYLFLLGIALHLTSKKRIDEVDNILSCLNIKIEYKDISDIKIIKKYKLTPSIFMFYLQDERINKARANFKIELLNK